LSFSKDVKEELFQIIPKSTHCRIAELAGIFLMEGKDSKNLSEGPLARKVFTLSNKTLNIGKDAVDDKQVLQQLCCKRAFIRGAFLASGSISDPNKGYHFEIVCNAESQALQLLDVMKDFQVEAKHVSRNGKHVVYLKEGAQIVEILRVMEAAHSVMELENIRVVKEVRGTVNRKVNCETANIGKTVSTAVRQIEDIHLIDEKIGLENIPQQLQEIAQVRLDNPDTPLGALGQFLDPPIGKSGVNHRLKKLVQMAEQL
jgi:DNA-binding protein WhiA